MGTGNRLWLPEERGVEGLGGKGEGIEKHKLVVTK